MNSLVTVKEQTNDELFMESLKSLDPNLWLIKTFLLKHKVNPLILPSVIEAVSRVDGGSGWGSVTVEIRDHRAIKCRGIDDKLLELEIS